MNFNPHTKNQSNGVFPCCCVSTGRPLSGAGPRRLRREEHEPARDPSQHQHRRHQYQSAEPLPVLRRRPAELTWRREMCALLMRRSSTPALLGGGGGGRVEGGGARLMCIV